MIDFNESIDSSLLDIKNKVRGNLFAWRGQFSPQLVQNLLSSYCPDNVSVFDPFGGSGTVLYECAAENKECYMTELNPAAWILSQIYEFANLSRSSREQSINDVKKFLIKNAGIFNLGIEPRLSEVVSKFRTSEYDSSAQKLFHALIILLDAGSKVLTQDILGTVFLKLSKIVLGLPFAELPVKSYLLDARRTNIQDKSIGFVITSPPYINVFNYHQNYRLSTELLGWDVLKIARSEIGSNRANRGNRFLTVIQYCFDMGDVLKELWRVCRSDARVILVVGRESTVSGVSWYNSSIIRKIAEESGYFKCVQIQERKFQNRFGKIIVEDLLHLEVLNNPSGDIRSSAKLVARDSFDAALKMARSEDAMNLESAKEKIAHIDGTNICH